MNRIRAGYVLTRNPFNHAQLSSVPLSPELVDCIVFWTKDAANLLPFLGELDALGYNYYFQYTLTPYDSRMERNLRPKSDIVATFQQLSRQVGCERMVWRYDPIVLNDELTVDYHKREFDQLCQALARFSDTVTISFVDLYPKVKTALVREISEEEIEELAAHIGETAARFGLEATACCERMDLTRFGISRASCIDRVRIEKITGRTLNLKQDKNQRQGCGCVSSIDIGAYGTCTNGCVYCYANRSTDSAMRRFEQHDPAGELLFGTVAEGETITPRRL